MAQQLINQAGL